MKNRVTGSVIGENGDSVVNGWVAPVNARSRHAFMYESEPNTQAPLGAFEEQVLFLDVQCPRQENDFRVRYTTQLGLDFGNCIFADVPASPRTTGGQHGLRPSLAVTNFSHDGTDDILRNGFAHDFALTVCERGLLFIPISEGTDLPANLQPCRVEGEL